jgi:hypothetical protein
MKYMKAQLILIVSLSTPLPLLAEDSPGTITNLATPYRLSLEGKSFKGHIRAKGIVGLFKVKGTLSFQEGLLVWTVENSRDSAPYKFQQKDGVLSFSSHVLNDNNTYVDWSGTYDGKTISNVIAVWNRAKEEDFVHDFFLPDMVTFVFKEKYR